MKNRKKKATALSLLKVNSIIGAQTKDLLIYRPIKFHYLPMLFSSLVCVTYVSIPIGKRAFDIRISNSTIIHCKNFCKCHNVQLKKEKKEYLIEWATEITEVGCI
jgi:hypothetical protein